MSFLMCIDDIIETKHNILWENNKIKNKLFFVNATYTLHTSCFKFDIIMIISSIQGRISMDYLQILGANIRAHRQRLGMTQEQLAESADLHRTYVGAIERGDRNVSLNNIVAIAKALNIEPYKLLIYKDLSKED